jgi:hypothetical protein
MKNSKAPRLTMVRPLDRRSIRPSRAGGGREADILLCVNWFAIGIFNDLFVNPMPSLATPPDLSPNQFSSDRSAWNNDTPQVPNRLPSGICGRHLTSPANWTSFKRSDPVGISTIRRANIDWDAWAISDDKKRIAAERSCNEMLELSLMLQLRVNSGTATSETCRRSSHAALGGWNARPRFWGQRFNGWLRGAIQTSCFGALRCKLKPSYWLPKRTNRETGVPRVVLGHRRYVPSAWNSVPWPRRLLDSVSTDIPPLNKFKS